MTLDGTVSVVQPNVTESSATLTLLAKPYGSSTFTAVGTANYTNSGTETPAELVVHPKKQTTYEWQFAGDNSTAGSVSPEFTVTVATKVTGKLADTTVSKGQTLSLYGKTLPRKRGSTIYLERKKGGHWVKIAHVRVTKRGRYTLRAIASAVGVWKVRAFLPAGGGNIAGHSPVRYAAVS